MKAMIELENRQQVFTAVTEDQHEAQAAFLEKRAALRGTLTIVVRWLATLSAAPAPVEAGCRGRLDR